MTEKLKEILENLKTKKTYLGKSKMTSGNEYLITLTYKGKKVSFHYHDNYNNESNKLDFVKALEMDAEAYGWCEDLNYFKSYYGFEDLQEAKKSYIACKKQYQRFNKLFTWEEQQEIVEDLDY